MKNTQQLVAKLRAQNMPFGERIPIDSLEKMVRRRNYREFARHFFSIILVTRLNNMQGFAGDDFTYFGRLLELWLNVLEKPAFELEDGDEDLFTINANIINLMAVTGVSGDDAIKKLATQPGTLPKILLLYTPRSRLEMPVKMFFDANPVIASMWYSCLWNWADTYVNPLVTHNYKHFFDGMDPRFEPFNSDLICGYFRCTYIDNVRDREMKRLFNAAVGRYCSGVRIRNNPNPRSIAVVSAYWNGEHAVYRAFAPYIEELAQDYELSLVNLAPPDKKAPETRLFKNVYTIEASPERINVSPIMENNFQLAYYPDVGMSQESLYLSNLRIAPIQCMGTGHPVSSTSPYMDYFISGGEVETPDRPEDNYDERLVLLPGLSVHPVKPKYVPQRPKPPERFIINCPWMHMKNNLGMAEALRKVYDKASRKVVFAIFPGCGSTFNASLPATIMDYSYHLPQDAYIIHHDYPYDVYMRVLEDGRFILHSYPFGGGTTAVDAFILGKPLVVLRGRHEYNRYSAALLTRIGLKELIADSLDDWTTITLRLIDEPDYLDDVSRRVREADLDRDLFRVSDAACLRRAFEELIKHHDVIQKDASRKPITT